MKWIGSNRIESFEHKIYISSSTQIDIMNDMINNGDEVLIDDYDDYDDNNDENNNDSNSNNKNYIPTPTLTGFILLIGFGVIVVIGVKCCLAYIQIKIHRRAHRLQNQHNNNNMILHRQQLDNQHIENNRMSQYNAPSSATTVPYTFRQNNHNHNNNMVVKVNEQCVLLNRMTIQERAILYNTVFDRNGNQTILSNENFIVDGTKTHNHNHNVGGGCYNEEDNERDTDIENNNNNNHNTISTAIATATATATDPPVASPSTTTVQQETTEYDTNQTTRNNKSSSIIQIPYNNSIKVTTCCTICLEIFKPGMQIVWSSSSSSSSKNNNSNNNSNSNNSRNNCQHIFCKQCIVDYFSTIQRTENTYTTNTNTNTNTTTTTRSDIDDDESSGSSSGTENTSGASGTRRNSNTTNDTTTIISSVVNDISNDVNDDDDDDDDDVINPCPVCRQEFVCIKEYIIII